MFLPSGRWLRICTPELPCCVHLQFENEIGVIASVQPANVPSPVLPVMTRLHIKSRAADFSPAVGFVP